MIKVVPDTNIFINTFFGNGKFKFDEIVIELEYMKNIKFVSSEFTQNECYKIFSRFVEKQNLFECSAIFNELYEIFKRSQYIKSPIKTDVISKDIADQNFLDLAVVSNANYLVTNDAESGLLAHKEHRNVKIVTPKEFLRQFDKIQKRKAK